jgi:hypothetical protein
MAINELLIDTTFEPPEFSLDYTFKSYITTLISSMYTTRASGNLIGLHDFLKCSLGVLQIF